MQYELAKELKDAGFPQLDYSCILQVLEDVAIQDKNDSSVWYYKPTLSELIEACAEKGVVRLNYATGAGATAEGNYSEHTEKFKTLREGKTPEESVAKLWLALNKK